MFGRLKLALVALILMPATAFAANEGARHVPGPATVAEVPAKAVPAEPADAGKHRSSVKAAIGGSTIATFIAGLRDQPAVLALVAKPSVAASWFAGAARPDLHRPA